MSFPEDRTTERPAPKAISQPSQDGQNDSEHSRSDGRSSPGEIIYNGGEAAPAFSARRRARSRASWSARRGRSHAAAASPAAASSRALRAITAPLSAGTPSPPATQGPCPGWSASPSAQHPRRPGQAPASRGRGTPAAPWASTGVFVPGPPHRSRTRRNAPGRDRGRHDRPRSPGSATPQGFDTALDGSPPSATCVLIRWRN